MWIAPNERHWHGATSSTLMSHTTTTIGATEFHDAVTEAEYAAANATPRAYPAFQTATRESHAVDGKTSGPLQESQMLWGPSWFWKISFSLAVVGSGTLPTNVLSYQTSTCSPVRNMETVSQPVELEPRGPQLLTESWLA